jgi:hypothetical protein
MRERRITQPFRSHKHPCASVLLRELVVGKRKTRTPRATCIFDHVVHTRHLVFHFTLGSLPQLLLAFVAWNASWFLPEGFKLHVVNSTFQ